VTIRKGEAWGEAGSLPRDGVVVRSDAEARAVVTAARRAGAPVPPLGLLGGDLCRAVGGSGDEARLREGGVILPVDLGAVHVDGRLHWFVAHLVARRGWWRGRVVAVMNAQHLGPWDVAPRGHPNDGRLDVLDGDLPFGQRLEARRRLRTGTHVPHPGIEELHVAALQLALSPGTKVWLDGEPLGPARNLSVRVEPDALRCVV
jgi:hypothetical protein